MSEEFCTGVKILLQRMETHPEEFYIEMPPNRAADNPKWGHLFTQIVSLKHGGDIRGEAIFLTEAEKDALYEGYSKLRRKALDDYVMREVLAPDEELSSPHKSKSALTKKQIINDSLRILQKELALT
jgi:hypothetical protein